METPLWRLVEGPEWRQSVEDANPHDEFFEDNLTAARQALAHNPIGFSRPFLHERDDVREFNTKDFAAGYRVVVFFRLDTHEVTVELGWVMLEAL